MHQGGLAGAAGADQRHQLSRRYFEVDVMQHIAIVVRLPITEVNMFETYALIEWWALLRARFLANIITGVKEIEDRRGCAQRLLKVVVEDPKLTHRFV